MVDVGVRELLTVERKTQGDHRSPLHIRSQRNSTLSITQPAPVLRAVQPSMG